MINEIKQNELARQEYTFLFNRYPDDIQRAIKRSEKKGLKKGIEKGLEKGIEQGILNTALNMKKANCDVSFISSITGLTKEEIEKL
ncbi:MAG: hypothetical protein ACTTKH_06985 [Treponema sp.]